MMMSLADVLQPGYRQIAAGYVVYGSSTMLVYSAGNGVHGFDVATAATLKNGESHSITVRYGGTAQDLYSTPKILTCSP